MKNLISDFLKNNIYSLENKEILNINELKSNNKFKNYKPEIYLCGIKNNKLIGFIQFQALYKGDKK